MIDQNYKAEVDRWGGYKPWVVADSSSGTMVRGQERKRASYRQVGKEKVPFDASLFKTDGQGNILSMTPVLRHPCFGRIEYALRHGMLKNTLPKVIDYRTGKPKEVASRCGNCELQPQCFAVVLERIKSTPTIKAAVKHWRDAPDQVRVPGQPRVYTGDERGKAGRAWTGVRAAIAAAGRFASVNDEAVAKHEAGKAAVVAAEAAKRQRACRARKLAAGEHDTDMIEAMPLLVRDFATLLNQHCDGPRADRAFSRLDAESRERVMVAWEGRETLRARQERHGIAHIERWIAGRGGKWAATKEGREQQIRRSLDRADKLFSTGVWHRPDPIAARSLEALRPDLPGVFTC